MPKGIRIHLVLVLGLAMTRSAAAEPSAESSSGTVADFVTAILDTIQRAAATSPSATLLCHGNHQCGPHGYCAKPPGDCDGVGRCRRRPQVCPENYDPVCGCDGNTYSNACFAAMAGVNVEHPGECREICGGIAGIPCDDPGEFCKLPTGHCCCDFQGVCTPIPQGCPDIYDPVCGCDGVTYGNECEADMAGVSVDHEGECEQICGGFAGIPCDDGEFCRLPDGQCCCDIQGVCAPIPQGCPDVWDPVCGCDGVTYGNRCEADMAGVSVDHEGECEQICGGFAGIPCDDGEFCRLPDGECCCDIQGVCAPIPPACPDNIDPVCGCDGVTYFNRCEADMAGVSVDHVGPCEQICGGITGIPCDDGEFCRLPDGECCCDFQGVCAPIPGACPDNVDPVCGCDGVTYFNRCQADMAGVSVDHVGPCGGEVCGGFAGIECPNGQFCLLPDGHCCCDFQGMCQVIPDACPAIYDPVCGCDGVTYGNRCEAAKAEQSVDYEGPCRGD